MTYFVTGRAPVEFMSGGRTLIVTLDVVAVTSRGAGGAGGGEAAEEKTEFDVVLTGFGDKKLNVVKVVKNLTGASLMEAKKMVEGVPATLKEGVSKEEAEKVKGEIEEAGGTVELK